MRINAASQLALLAALFGAVVHAQDISGDWQGTIKTPRGEFRDVLHIVKEADGGWKATVFSVDQSTEGFYVDSLTLQSSSIKFTIDQIQASYEGKIAADGSGITGTFTAGQPPQHFALDLKRATKETAWPTDPTPHTVQFISVEKDVKLEVLDWGGSGRPVVLLTGQGNNAHVYDQFAPKLIGAYHVYGITRRGYGASGHPAFTRENYSADRLGDDVLAVIDALKLTKPVLVGHSLGGEELSSVGSRHAEKVAGLIYLDAAYTYAYYDKSRGDLHLESLDAQRKLTGLLDPDKALSPQNLKPLVRDLLETSLPALEKSLRDLQTRLAAAPTNAQAPSPSPRPPAPPVQRAVDDGMQEYTDIRAPILAIYALPHDRGITDAKEREAADAADLAYQGEMAKAFEKAFPSARVVRLPHANHYVFRSNEADVLREMNAFIASLPQPSANSTSLTGH